MEGVGVSEVEGDWDVAVAGADAGGDGEGWTYAARLTRQKTSIPAGWWWGLAHWYGICCTTISYVVVAPLVLPLISLPSSGLGDA